MHSPPHRKEGGGEGKTNGKNVGVKTSFESLLELSLA